MARAKKMMHYPYKTAVDRLNCALELERQAAGVGFIFSESEFDRAEATALKGKIRYCQMVNAAMQGNQIKARLENFACSSGATALGLLEYQEYDYSGRSCVDVKMYQDLATARDVCKNLVFCQHKAYGVVLRPLEKFEDQADVAIIMTNTYNMMRIIQGYSFKYGSCGHFRMTGNQAMCCECTSHPFEINDINLSLMCCGARRGTKSTAAELAMGIPASRFINLVDGICATINPMEPDVNKAVIEKKLKARGFDEPQIEFHKNYYTE